MADNTNNRTALITGSTRGIGLATAIEFLKNGDSVVVFCRHKEHGDEAFKALRKHGAKENVLITVGDVRNVNDVNRVISEAIERFGSIDILVNNAGQAVWKPIGETTEGEWNAVLDTNLKGAYLFMRRVVPFMKEQGGGIVINISSGLGVQGRKNYSAYSASKFGLIGLTQAVADEVRDTPLKIYAVLPGAVATKLHLDVHPWEDPEAMMTPEYVGKKVFEVADGTRASGDSIEIYS